MGISSKRRLILAAVALALGFGSAGASTYTVLHNFPGAPQNPRSGLVADGAGHLYGISGSVTGGLIFKINTDGTGLTILHEFTLDSWNGWGTTFGTELTLLSGTLYGVTYEGGAQNAGTVFRIGADGSAFTLLHSFDGAHAAGPTGGVTADGNGNLYGAAIGGEVYKLRTDGTGFSVLHTPSSPSDSEACYGRLLFDGAGNLFGTSYLGGANNLGTVFSVKTDGTGYSVLHSFTLDAQHPFGGLSIDAQGNIFGTTEGNGGTIFTLKTNGSGFAVLRTLSSSDGIYPYAPLLLDSGVLYGTTTQGGVNKSGTVFAMKTDGSNFSVLHAFPEIEHEGYNPYGVLILDNAGNLFGTTAYGGTGSSGTVFTIKTNGSGFAVLSSFLLPDASFPSGSLIQDSSGTLYGTSSAGGPNGYGSIFSVQPGGTGYSLLHTFSYVDGAFPNAGLILAGDGYLYGTVENGSPFGYGAVFKIKTNGTSFSLLHNFDYQTPYPEASLILENSTDLYGTSSQGSVFTLKTDGSGFAILHTFNQYDNLLGGVISDGAGNLYGTTSGIGSGLGGAIFRLGENGGGYTVLHSFTGGDDGANPRAGLVLDSAGYLLGTASTGGVGGGGTVFKLKTDGSSFSIVHQFAAAANDGFAPWASLMEDPSGLLYGTTHGGGANGAGTIYRITPDGFEFSILYSFVAGLTDGGRPSASLIRDASGTLFGTAFDSGTGGGGVVFKLAGVTNGGGSLPAPTVTSPTQGQTITVSRMTLAWNSVNDATGYDFRVVDDSNGLTIYSGDLSGFSSTSTVVDLPNGGLTFGVRACSGGFADANCGPFATVDFTVNVLPPTTSTTKFYTLTPCRIADTRNAAGPYGGPALSAGVSRVFKLTGQCGIPTGAKAASVNITVVTPTDPGELKLNPTGADPQVASAVSFPAGRVLANNAMVFLGTDGAMTVFDAQDAGTTHFIIDVNGYFK